MPSLSRDQFLQPKDLKRIKVPLPEFGAKAYVNVQQLTGKQLTQLLKSHKAKGDDTEFLARLLCLSLVDDEGQQLFDAEADVDAMLGKNVNLLKSLAEQALDLNGLTDDQTKKN